MTFKPVPAKVNFPELEEKILKRWYDSGLVKKYLHKNDNSPRKFFFLDGPITANNAMGVHHGWGRTLKDFFQRYKNMRGYRELFRNGFDNQGLWVEVEVEKELGFKAKKDIEKYGIAKFVNKCKERTLKFAKVQTEQSKRLGYFMNWDNSYYTMSDENNYMIWHFLKKCWQDGNLYKGRDTVPWCPRCGTAISQHEILTEEYKEVVHRAVFFKYPIVGKKKESFLVWTTSPWTIPADVALAVNPEFMYARFKNKKTNEVLIFLRDLGSRIFVNNKDWKKIEEFSGRKLEGLYYQGPFDDLPRNVRAKKEDLQKYHLVFLEKELVTAEEGTGVVHISPGSGPEDYQLAKREGLPVTEVIDEAGYYLDGYGSLTGKNAKDHPELIFDLLKKKESDRFFYKIENYRHRYPLCWRCKTELVWRVVDEWYIAMDNQRHQGSKNYRQRMVEVVKKIRWIPEFGLKRELDWLKNMDDWLIGKKRYWGLALPIWECSCGHFEVIGSKEELKKRAIVGWKEFAGHSPHRPWVDRVKIRCPKCKRETSRVPDVGNPWLDAGIVSFSTLIDPKTKKVSYMDNKEYWRKWFPADFVTESFPGQFKNWFYSLIAMSTVLENKPPFKTLLGYASVRDEKGEEMHKSKGNAIEFNAGAEKMGVDVMRWVYLSQNPTLNLNFGFRVGDETRRRFHLLLWNIYKFFVDYANIDDWQKKGDPHKSNHVLDKWIVSRLNQLVKIATESLDKYDAFTVSHAIEDFVSDLSTWYVRRSRDRIGPTVEDGDDKNFCYLTLWEVLASICQILAPFTPFMAEEMYQNLTGKESVHLEDWPKAGRVDRRLLEQMALARKICELGHAARKEARIKVRQPLVAIKLLSNQAIKLDEELIQLIKDELNVKKVVFKKGKISLGVKLDTKITPELRAEGEARELVRQIQELRKKAGCKLDQKIKVYGPKFPEGKGLREYIKSKTLASELIEGEELKIE